MEATDYAHKHYIQNQLIISMNGIHNGKKYPKLNIQYSFYKRNVISYAISCSL